MPEPDWDPATHKDVDARMAQMNDVRAKCPVAFMNRNGGAYALMRHADLVATASDPARFSNAGASRYAKPLPPLEFDPPVHGPYRRLLQRFFTPARIRALEIKVRHAAKELLAPMLASGGGDLARDYSYPLPVIGLCALLKIPDACWADIKSWSEFTLLRDSDDEKERALADAGHERILVFARALIADRRAHPRCAEDDIPSALLAARIDGEALDDDFIARTLRILISAGHNSTTSAIGNSLLYLAQHPDDQDLLRREPARIPAAIEEFLRWETPVQEMPRWANEAVTICDRPIPAGARLAMFWASGNRDEAAFPDAGQCILDRKPNRHLAFGSGIHACLGAPMARMEIRVALEGALASTTRIELDGAFVRADFHRMGVVTLPAKLTPA